MNDKIARPLLPFSRNQIYEYAKTHNIQWCEDGINKLNKYEN